MEKDNTETNTKDLTLDESQKDSKKSLAVTRKAYKVSSSELFDKKSVKNDRELCRGAGISLHDRKHSISCLNFNTSRQAHYLNYNSELVFKTRENQFFFTGVLNLYKKMYIQRNPKTRTFKKLNELGSRFCIAYIASIAKNKSKVDRRFLGTIHPVFHTADNKSQSKDLLVGFDRDMRQVYQWHVGDPDEKLRRAENVKRGVSLIGMTRCGDRRDIVQLYLGFKREMSYFGVNDLLSRFPVSSELTADVRTKKVLVRTRKLREDRYQKIRCQNWFEFLENHYRVFREAKESGVLGTDNRKMKQLTNFGFHFEEKTFFSNMLINPKNRLVRYILRNPLVMRNQATGEPERRIFELDNLSLKCVKQTIQAYDEPRNGAAGVTLSQIPQSGTDNPKDAYFIAYQTAQYKSFKILCLEPEIDEDGVFKLNNFRIIHFSHLEKANLMITGFLSNGRVAWFQKKSKKKSKKNISSVSYLDHSTGKFVEIFKGRHIVKVREGSQGRIEIVYFKESKSVYKDIWQLPQFIER